MKNKYYTPKIEQFVIGFEYELQDDNGDWMWSNAPQDIELLKKCIKDKKCRSLTNEYLIEKETKAECDEKTLGNTDTNGAKKNVKDIEFWGDGDTFKLISKASSKKEGWMKSTKVMEIQGAGCLVQVTTQQGSNVAEAVTFIPRVRLHEEKDNNGTVIRRWLSN